MTKRLEEILNIESVESAIVPESIDATPVNTIDLQEKLE